MNKSTFAQKRYNTSTIKLQDKTIGDFNVVITAFRQVVESDNIDKFVLESECAQHQGTKVTTWINISYENESKYDASMKHADFVAGEFKTALGLERTDSNRDELIAFFKSLVGKTFGVTQTETVVSGSTRYEQSYHKA